MKILFSKIAISCCLLSLVGCASLANKDDLYLLKTETNEEIASLHTELARLQEQVRELTQNMDYLEKDASNQILNLSSDVSTRLSVLETESERNKEEIQKKINVIVDEVSRSNVKTSARHSKKTPPPGSQIYVVKTGDTLSRIARSFGLTQEELMNANGMDNPNYLSIGAKIVIPVAAVDLPAD